MLLYEIRLSGGNPAAGILWYLFTRSSAWPIASPIAALVGISYSQALENEQDLSAEFIELKKGILTPLTGKN